MFTGIVELMGMILELVEMNGDYRMKIQVEPGYLKDVKIGDSIAVNGVCLTVIAYTEDSFSVDVSTETMRCTSLGHAKVMTQVNLERAMKASGRLDGHIVSGHVDGLADVVSVEQDARSVVIHFKVEPVLAQYIAKKGSVCVDGVSLTVNEVSDQGFSVMIIPHTQKMTVIKYYVEGSKVNIEVDLLARYVERLLHVRSSVEA